MYLVKMEKGLPFDQWRMFCVTKVNKITILHFKIFWTFSTKLQGAFVTQNRNCTFAAYKKFWITFTPSRAVVVAQLIEQSHTTQGSEVQIQSLITLCYLHTVNCIEKPKIKKKIPRMALSSSKAYESNGLVPVCLVLAKFLQRAEVFCDFWGRHRIWQNFESTLAVL